LIVHEYHVSQQVEFMQVSSANLSQIAYPESIQAARSQQKNSSEEASETAAQKAAESAGQGDTVKLSLYMQAKLLRRQGYSVAQIASQLGLDAKNAKFRGIFFGEYEELSLRVRCLCGA
jgi:hypothetical protein